MAFLTVYHHEDIVLDLYGTRDEDGISLTAIKVRGDKQDISDLFTSKQEQHICERADEQMSRDAAAHNAEARAERAMESYA